MRYSHISSQAASAWISLINQHAYLITRSSELVVATLMKTSVYFGQGFAVCSSYNPSLRLCWLCSQKAKQSFNWMSKPFLTKGNKNDNIPWYRYDCITIQVEVDNHYSITCISYCCRAHLTPYLWMPKWIEASDPSARTLKHYRTSGIETKNGNLCNTLAGTLTPLYMVD